MNVLDRTVANMVARFGTTAYISVAASEVYDPATSKNIVTFQDYLVNVMFFDYIRKTEGVGTENNTLVQTGDKQVYVQPPQKNGSGVPLPSLQPNKDLLKFNGKVYKIVTVKQYNPSQSLDGCILYELYVRE